MVEGQSGTVYGLAPHPTMSRMYATACADGYVGIWDAEHRTNVKMIKVERGKVTREQRKRGMVGWDDDEKPMEGAKEKVSPHHDTAASLGCTLPRVPAMSLRTGPGGAGRLGVLPAVLRPPGQPQRPAHRRLLLS